VTVGHSEIRQLADGVLASITSLEVGQSLAAQSLLGLNAMPRSFSFQLLLVAMASVGP
jgi:hypothetical protein